MGANCSHFFINITKNRHFIKNIHYIYKTIFSMIYLDENTKRVYIPKTRMINPNTIEFENNITHNKIEFDVYDLDPNAMKYDIDLTQNLSLFTNGQYTYRLWSETHDLLSSGVAQFGEFNSAEATDYNANVDIIEYKMEN